MASFAAAGALLFMGHKMGIWASAPGSADGNLPAVFLCAFSYGCTGRGSVRTDLRRSGSAPGKEAADSTERKGLYIGRKEI